MLRRFEYSQGTSNKFYEIEITCVRSSAASTTSCFYRLQTRYGRIGTSGAKSTREFYWPFGVVHTVNKLTRQKLSKGYICVREIPNTAPELAGIENIAISMGRGVFAPIANTTWTGEVRKIDALEALDMTGRDHDLHPDFENPQDVERRLVAADLTKTYRVWKWLGALGANFTPELVELLKVSGEFDGTMKRFRLLELD